MNELTEKQKMVQGDWFFPSNKILQADRAKAKQLCYQFNQCPPDQRKQGARILLELFAQSPSSYIEAPFQCDYGYNISVGKQFYANHGLIILDAAPVTIGDSVLIGPNVMISTLEHPHDPQRRMKGLAIAARVTIGDNVWIGMGAIILAGVTIGDNAIVGAGAVVTKDVAADAKVMGVPARNVAAQPK